MQALQNRRNGANVANAIEAEPVEAQIVQKNRIANPTTNAIEAEIVTPTSTRKGIAVKDIDAGAQEIPVNRTTQSRGKYIDSVVDRTKANLPEAQQRALGERFADYAGVPNYGDETLVRAMGNTDTIFGGDDGYRVAGKADMPVDDQPVIG